MAELGLKNRLDSLPYGRRNLISRRGEVTEVGWLEKLEIPRSSADALTLETTTYSQKLLLVNIYVHRTHCEEQKVGSALGFYYKDRLSPSLTPAVSSIEEYTPCER